MPGLLWGMEFREDTDGVVRLLKPAPKPKFGEIRAGLHQLLWDLSTETPGLRRTIAEAVFDAAVSEGEERPYPEDAEVPYSLETGKLAAALLADYRIGDHPYLRGDQGPYRHWEPIWQKDFEYPPGLAFHETGNVRRSTLITQTGAGRELYEGTERSSDRAGWVLPVEVVAYFARLGI